MKRFYALVASAIMLMPTMATAQSMTQDNEILAGWNYRLEKDVNFVSGIINEGMSGEISVNPNDKLEFGAEDTSVKLNGYAPNRLTNNGLEFMGVCQATGYVDLVAGKGLRSTKNERWIVVNDLRKGQIISFEISNQDTTSFVVNSIACNAKTGWQDTPCDPLTVEPISGSVHELQELAEEGSADTYRYFKVINAGSLYAKFNGKSANYISRMQIWTSNEDAEAVTSPSIKMVGVNGEARNMEFTSGTSTLGASCSTYYSLNGSDPVFLKDSEEVDYWEYTYKTDGEGNKVLDENGNPVKEDSTAVYKRVLDLDEVANVGDYGDYKFNPEDGYITVSSSDDEDGDGIVTIKYATVSENGVLSNIVSENVNVGEITLNVPTLTLTGINGKERTYTIGWTPNTLCNEDYSMVIENKEGAYIETEANTGIGETVSSSEWVKVTVKVNGYADGVAELAEVDAFDTDLQKRTDIGNEMSADHNWDFCSLSEQALKQINGEVYEKYVVKNEETGEVLREYTVEQVENELVPEEDVDKIEPVVKYFGWDGADNRNAARHWRTHVPTFEVDGEGNPTETVASVAYAEDETGILKGIVADNSHPDYSCMAIFTDQSGVFYMTKGTLTINDVKYGEYVMLNTSAGITVTKNESTDPMTFTINQGVYVKSIDVYTYEGLPEPDSIEDVDAAKAEGAAAIYNVNGILISSPQKGINIIRTANGVRKVMVK